MFFSNQYKTLGEPTPCNKIIKTWFPNYDTEKSRDHLYVGLYTQSANDYLYQFSRENSIETVKFIFLAFATNYTKSGWTLF